MRKVTQIVKEDLARAYAARSARAHPGATLKLLREERGWTLAELGRRAGFTVSALSKMENNRVAMTYDKLARISASLGVEVSRLFGPTESADDGIPVRGRRSVTRAGDGKTPGSTIPANLHLHADLLNKCMVPVIISHVARGPDQVGALVRYSGEQFIYVLEGAIDVYTDVYAPLRLNAGDSVYLDSAMAHGYGASHGPCRVLAVYSGNEREVPAAAGAGAGPSAVGAARSAPLPKRARRRSD